MDTMAAFPPGSTGTGPPSSLTSRHDCFDLAGLGCHFSIPMVSCYSWTSHLALPLLVRQKWRSLTVTEDLPPHLCLVCSAKVPDKPMDSRAIPNQWLLGLFSHELRVKFTDGGTMNLESSASIGF